MIINEMFTSAYSTISNVPFLIVGTVFGIPYNENLAGLTLLVSILDKNHDLTVDIAESTLCLAEDSSNQLTTLGSTPKECSANLTRNKGRERVGKLIYRISRISIFSEGVSEKNFSKKKNPEKEELNVLCNLPDFQFRRLVKPIHWERLKSLNLDRYSLFLGFRSTVTLVCQIYSAAFSSLYLIATLYSLCSLTLVIHKKF